jgi:hypothetical protein
MLPLDVVDQACRPRAEAANPLELAVPARRGSKQPLGELLEPASLMRLRDREAPDEHAPNTVGAFGILIEPGLWCPRTGGEHVDVVAFAHVFGQQPTRVFRPSADLGSVARCDERESHAGTPSRAG